MSYSKKMSLYGSRYSAFVTWGIFLGSLTGLFIGIFWFNLILSLIAGTTIGVLLGTILGSIDYAKNKKRQSLKSH